KYGFAQCSGSIDRRAVDKRRVRVQRMAVLGVAPAADEIEVLECKADRIHDLVAGGTSWICAMRFEAITQGREYTAIRRAFFRQIGFNTGRWRRYRRAEDV